MDAIATTPAKPKLRINRFLPYWAVLQMDFRQAIGSWVYRIWVLLSVLASIGYLLYKLGAQDIGHMIQHASHSSSDLIKWMFMGSVGLVVVLSGGSISAERGIMADSVLSRGISRYQYFFGKWHARVMAVMCTFLVMGGVTLATSHLFLHEDLSPIGSLMAMATVLAFLAFVTSCGVAVSALTNTTIAGIALLGLTMGALVFGLYWLPAAYLTPNRVIMSLPNILRGSYELARLGRMIGWTLLASLIVALVGAGAFSRRDV